MNAPLHEHAPVPGGIEARQAALSLLEQVLGRRQPLDQAWEADKNLSALPVRDRAFVRMAVATALRRLGQIDDLIRRASERAEMPSPPLLLQLLRLGAAQIAFMDVPDYAVVDTAVSLAEKAGFSRQKGFVNAALRRIAAEHRPWIAMQDAARLNTPDWLMKTWIADYGLRAAAEIAQANGSEAPLDISIKNPAMAQHWAQTLEAAILPTGTLRRAGGGLVQELPGYADGMWWIQDASSALPARLFGDDLAGRHVIDMCAAPGGKTMQLLSMGAHVTAIDRSPARIARLEENLYRLRLTNNVRLEIADSASWQPPAPAEYILLDAPCTATGTARRHPDVPHLKTPKDMAALVQTQMRLLDNAAGILALGGILIYCTCSLQKDEGERQIEQLLKTHKNMRRLPVSPAETGNIEGIITPEGDVRVLPFHLAAHGGMDGFYIARLRKV